jgi:2,4-dienoyl-CoA reductase-like NADH-dependent reductase (Old Yellow Enzyme family)
MKPTSRLFAPIILGGITLANRIAVSPMCQYSAEDGSANDWHLQHSARRRLFA